MLVRRLYQRRKGLQKIIISTVIGILLLNIQVNAQLAKDHDKFLGNVYGNNGVRSHFTDYWNQVTPENAGKFGSVAIGENTSVWQWGGLDAAYNYAKNNGFPFKSHALIWGQQEPYWISYLDSAEQIEKVEEWIRLVGERYRAMDMIDVVNEPLQSNAQPSFKAALGGAGETGWDWVIWSFEKARQYCSDSTELILNEYNLLNNMTNTNRIVEIANLLKERNLVDAIGVQAHYFELRGVNPTIVNNNLDRLAATELPVYISELEIDVADDNQQLTEYYKYFPIIWEHPGVKGVTLWGYEQNRMWKVDGYLRRQDGSERPALRWLRAYLNGEPFMNLSRSRFEFPEWPVGYSTNLSYTISNYGVDTLRISDISCTASEFITDTTLLTILPGESYTDTLRFNPQTEGAISAYLVITSNISSSPDSFTITGTAIPATSVDQFVKLPERFDVSRNYPNPFNPTTSFQYVLPHSTPVKVIVYNLQGKTVKTLVNTIQNSGTYTAVWDATNNVGQTVPSGIYLYRIEASGQVLSRKMLLMK